MRDKFVEFLHNCKTSKQIKSIANLDDGRSYFFHFTDTNYFFTVVLYQNGGKAWFWTAEPPFSFSKEKDTKGVSLNELLESGPKEIQDFITFNVDIFGHTNEGI